MKQVDKSHYIKNYDSISRWNSYYHQIDEIMKLNPNSVLEIGIGNGTVSNYLKDKINITTCDIDPELNPDIIADVTDLFQLKSHDVILCSQVLEHIPYNKFGMALRQIRQKCNYAIISLPDNSFNFSFTPIISLPFKISKYKLLKLNFTFTLPFPNFLTKPHIFDGEHYWEIGKKGYSLKTIRKSILEEFEIENEFVVPQNLYHRFFILKAKK